MLKYKKRRIFPMKKVLSLMLAAAMLLSVSVFCVSAEKTEFPFSLTT